MLVFNSHISVCQKLVTELWSSPLAVVEHEAAQASGHPQGPAGPDIWAAGWCWCHQSDVSMMSTTCFSWMIVSEGVIFLQMFLNTVIFVFLVHTEPVEGWMERATLWTAHCSSMLISPGSCSRLKMTRTLTRWRTFAVTSVHLWPISFRMFQVYLLYVPAIMSVLHVFLTFLPQIVFHQFPQSQ